MLLIAIAVRLHAVVPRMLLEQRMLAQNLLLPWPQRGQLRTMITVCLVGRRLGGDGG
jgi:hypothetical protein